MTQRNRRRHRRRGGARSKLRSSPAAPSPLIAAGAIVAASWVIDVVAEAPPLSDCRPIEKGGNSILIAGDGERLGYIASEEARTPVAIDRIPTDLQYATVAIEDERFFKHDGIDYEGGLRAADRERRGRRDRPGRLDDHDAADAQPLHHRPASATSSARSRRPSWRSSTSRSSPSATSSASTSTAPPTGRSTAPPRSGVQAASRIYFSKPVWKLTLEQSALLAGLPQAPSDYNPILNPEGARARRNDVLASMAKLGYISRERALEGQQRGLGIDLSDTYFVQRQPYFFDYVEDKLIEKYGVNTVRKGGLRVYTTVDPRLQEDRLRSDALRPSLFRRPVRGAGRDRPADRLHQGDGLQLQLRRQPVQPRRPGPPPARLHLQDLRPDDGDQAGHRPLLDLLHLETAQPRPARMGPLGGGDRRRGLPGDDQPAAGDGRLRQHRLRPARPRRRPRERRRDGEVDGDHNRTRRHPGRGDRRPADRRLAAGDVLCLRDARRRRHPPQPDRDPPGRLPRRPGRPPRGGRPEAGRAGSGRLRGDPAAARQHHRRHRHRRLHRLRRPGRQDGDDRQLHRRLVRRLPAQPGDRGLGRLPAVERDRNDQRPRHDRLRRHLPGRNLALALRQRRSPLRGIRTNPRRRSAGRRTTANSPRPAATATTPTPKNGEEEERGRRKAQGRGSDRRLRPRRLRAWRRPGTDRGAGAGAQPTAPQPEAAAASPVAPPPAASAPADGAISRRRSRCAVVTRGPGPGMVRPPMAVVRLVPDARGRVERSRSLLRAALARIRRLSGGPARVRRGWSAGSSGRRSPLLVAAFAVAPALLSQDVLSYLELCPPRRRPRSRPLLEPAGSSPFGPVFPDVGWTEDDELLRPVVHPPHLSPRLAPGRRPPWPC